MIVRTKNSTYEIDQDAKLIRRVNGKNPPLDVFGQDMTWRSYAAVYCLQVGESVIVYFDDAAPIHTSTVVAMEPEELCQTV